MALRILLVLSALLTGLESRVVNNSRDCSQHFYKGFPPSGFPISNHRKFICQTAGEEERTMYSTYYDTSEKIPMYSAYKIEEGDFETERFSWSIEPQLSSMDKVDYMLPQDDDTKSRHSQSQATDEDYSESDYRRGHLNTNFLTGTRSQRKSAFTLTNAVPIDGLRSSFAWYFFQRASQKVLFEHCKGENKFAVSGIKSVTRTRFLNNRVRVPDGLWSAYCCEGKTIDENISFGFFTTNSNESVSVSIESLEDLEKMLTLNGINEFKIFKDNCGGANAVSKKVRAELENIFKDSDWQRVSEIISEHEDIGINLIEDVDVCGGKDVGGYNVQLNAMSDNVWSIMNSELKSAGLVCKESPSNDDDEVNCCIENTSTSNSDITVHVKRNSTSSSATAGYYTAGNTRCYGGGQCERQVSGNREYYDCAVDKSGKRELCCHPDHSCNTHDEYYFYCYTKQNVETKKMSELEYCSPKNYSRTTITSKPCVSWDTCGLHGWTQNWCYVDDDKNWDYCCSPWSQCDALHGKCHTQTWSPLLVTISGSQCHNEYNDNFYTTGGNKCYGNSKCERKFSGSFSIDTLEYFECPIDEEGTMERCCHPRHNCSVHDEDYHWCYSELYKSTNAFFEDDKQAEWAYCSPPNYSNTTVKGNQCIDGHSCGLHGKKYNWCYVNENQKSEYCCAPYSSCEGKMCYTQDWGFTRSYCTDETTKIDETKKIDILKKIEEFFG